MNLDRLYEEFDRVQYKPLFRRDRDGNRVKIGDAPYLTARDVMDRLDEVFGVLNWDSKFEVVAENTVKCTLTVRTENGVVTKEDFGYSTSNSDMDNGIKGAASDALKRACVHLGIGRYLYGNLGDDRGREQDDRPQQRLVKPVAEGKPSFKNRKPSRYERQPQGKPFGLDDDEESDSSFDYYSEVVRLMREDGFTPEDFKMAFGVVMSKEVVEDIVADKGGPEAIIQELREWVVR